MSQVDAGDWPRADVNKDYHTTVIVHGQNFFQELSSFVQMNIVSLRWLTD